jgi:hypothetical protein
MEEVAEVWTIIRGLLESQRLAVLSTQGKKQPYSNLVMVCSPKTGPFKMSEFC